MKRALLILNLMIAPAASAEESKFENCHEMSTDYIRLMCYDKETGYTKPQKNEPVQQPEAKIEQKQANVASGAQWRYAEEKSALDARKDVWLSVSSKNTEPNSIGSPIRATLWARCMENKTNLFIGFDSYTTDDQNVRYKIGDGSIKKQWMQTMRGGDGIGIWSGSKAIPFIKNLLDQQILVIAYDTYNGPVEFTFDISGLKARIEPLATECGWVP